MSRVPLTFRIHRNGHPVREETLALGVIKIGKVPSAQLKLDDESVSRMHAIVEVDAKGVVHIIDLGSTRGTYVNGAKINKARLQTGDRIQCGDVKLELSIGVAEAGLEPGLGLRASGLGETPEVPPPPVPAPRVPIAPLVIAPPTVTQPTVAMRPASVTPVAPIPVPPVLAEARSPKPGARLPRPEALASPRTAVDMSEVEDATATSIEVAALFADSLVTVKHCSDPRSGRIRPATYALLAAGLTGLVTAAVSFTSAVLMQHRNDAALEQWTHVAHKPMWAFRPETSGPLSDGLTSGGVALGLAGLALGFARARRERRSPFFRIGTAPGVEHATQDAPAPSFPLVAPSGDDFVLNVGPGIAGEMTVDGTTTPFAELARAGLGRPSALLPDTIEVPIPAHARIRAHAGATTFVVASVPRPREHAMPLLAFDGRTAAYLAGSLAVHLALWGALALGSDAQGTVAIDVNNTDELRDKYASIASETVPPDPVPDDGESSDSSSGPSGATAMAEGASGNLAAPLAQAHIRVANNGLPPQLARDEAIELARTAGVLGSTKVLDGIRQISGGDADFVSGFDNATMWGGLMGPDGESFGNGVGRFGLGGGGGCTHDCGGIGAGNYNTIGQGGKAGDGYGVSGGYGHGHGRTPGVPTVALSQATVMGSLDKSIIRRYIMRQYEKIRYCYDKQLLVHSGLSGDVVVQFLIQPNGTVASSFGAASGGMDQPVASCAADVIGAIAFPAPKDGGSVQVRFPLSFHAAGADK